MIRLGPSRSLNIVGWLLLLGGISAVLNAIVGKSTPRVHTLDFSVVGIFLGAGVLRRRPWALKWSELFVVLPIFFAAPVAIILILTRTSELATASVLGYPLGTVSQPGITLALLGFIALSIWEYRVLIRDDVRALARKPEDA